MILAIIGYGMFSPPMDAQTAIRTLAQQHLIILLEIKNELRL